MGGEALEFGRHAPYVIAAYIASIVIIGGLIISRRSKLKKALEAESNDDKTAASDEVSL